MPTPPPKLNYTYDPTKIKENGVDRMRFELGDTMFAPGELTAALCDEEYEAAMSQYPTWKRKKFACLTAIMMKYSHQVDTKADAVSYSLSQRFANYKKLYDGLKAELSVSGPGPGIMDPARGGKKPPYFYEDMQANPERGVF